MSYIISYTLDTHRHICILLKDFFNFIFMFTHSRQNQPPFHINKGKSPEWFDPRDLDSNLEKQPKTIET